MPQALLAGLGIPALGLFGVFSLIPYERMTAEWPLRISPEEVHLYQRWFDQRPDTMAEVEVQRFDLDSSGTCLESEAGEVRRRFSARGYADSAQVVRIHDGWMITFPDGRPFREQHTIMLRPAGLSSIRALYAREVAKTEGFGMICGRAELVRLWSCGDDAGLFLAEEVITERSVDEHGTPGSILLDSLALISSDSAIVKEAGRSVSELVEHGDLSRMSGVAAAEWGVLSDAAQLNTNAYAAAWFQPSGPVLIPALMSTGRAEEAPGSMAAKALSYYLSTEQAQEAVHASAEALRQDSAKLAQGLAGIDALNAAAFVGDTRIGYVRAQLAHEREGFLRRLFHPDPKARYGVAAIVPPMPASPAVALDPLLRKYLVGDTVRFPRAKHLIDHVITVPAGIGVVLEKGARLNMAPGSGLIVNGSLHMRGTGLNPVFIRPTDEGAAWAGICVNGTGHTRCVISGLKMSGGSMLKDQQGDHDAMLSFHGCDVTLASSSIMEAHGPAAVAVVRGSLTMRDCVLGTGVDALLRLDLLEAEVYTCSFMGSAKPVGVRVNAAQVRFNDCGFGQFSGNGLVCTTRSKAALRGCVFNASGTAVLATDGSEIHVDGCTFTGNSTAIGLEHTRAGRPGGHATVYANTFNSNGADKRVDDRSTWTDGVGPMQEVISSPVRAD